MFKFRNLNRLQNMTFVHVQCGCIQTIPYLEVTKRTNVCGRNAIYMEEKQHITECVL